MSVFQTCIIAVNGLVNLNTSCADQSTINILIVMNNLLRVQMKGIDLLGDGITHREWQYSRLTAMNSEVEKHMKITIFPSSQSKQRYFEPTIPSVHTYQYELAIYLNATNIFMKIANELTVTIWPYIIKKVHDILQRSRRDRHQHRDRYTLAGIEHKYNTDVINRMF